MYIEYRKILKHNPMDRYILSSIMRAGAEFMRETVATISYRINCRKIFNALFRELRWGLHLKSLLSVVCYQHYLFGNSICHY